VYTCERGGDGAERLSTAKQGLDENRVSVTPKDKSERCLPTLAEFQYFFVLLMLGAMIEAYRHPKIVKPGPAFGPHEVGDRERQAGR
jgi:hypothetical protein